MLFPPLASVTSSSEHLCTGFCLSEHLLSKVTFWQVGPTSDLCSHLPPGTSSWCQVLPWGGGSKDKENPLLSSSTGQLRRKDRHISGVEREPYSLLGELGEYQWGCKIYLGARTLWAVGNSVWEGKVRSRREEMSSSQRWAWPSGCANGVDLTLCRLREVTLKIEAGECHDQIWLQEKL